MVASNARQTRPLTGKIFNSKDLFVSPGLQLAALRGVIMRQKQDSSQGQMSHTEAVEISPLGECVETSALSRIRSRAEIVSICALAGLHKSTIVDLRRAVKDQGGQDVEQLKVQPNRTEAGLQIWQKRPVVLEDQQRSLRLQSISRF